MKSLNPDWITQGMIDFEYKKYILLAYLQEVDKNFKESRLYPFLSDLVFQYNNLLSLKNGKTNLHNSFPKELTGFNLIEMTIEFKNLLESNKSLEEIEQILEFSIPKIKDHLQEGSEIYNEIEGNISIEPVGLVPMNKDFGYILIQRNEKRATRVYEYQTTIYQSAQEKFRGIKTTYITSYPNTIMNNISQIKVDLIQKKKEMPNPATFHIDTSLLLPFDETLLPIAKRSLMRYLAGLE